MPILRPSGSDFTALVKAAAQYVPAGTTAKVTKSGGGMMLAPPSLGAVARTSQVGALVSPTTSAVYINGITPPPPPPPPPTLPISIGDDAFIVKYDTNGKAQWATTIRGSVADGGLGLAVDSTGVYVTGYYESTSVVTLNNGKTLPISVTTDAFVAKYDRNGNALWATTIRGTGSGRGHGISVDSTGVYVTGSYNSTSVITLNNGKTLPISVGNDAFIVKYDTNGLAQWATTIRGTSSDSGYTVKTDSTGVYVTGFYASTSVITLNNGKTLPISVGTNDAFTVKYDTNGLAQWATTISGTGSGFGFGLAVDSTGVYVTGYYTSTSVVTLNSGVTLPISTGVQDVYIVKYDTNGNAVWATTIQGWNQGYAIATDSTGVYVSGYYSSTSVVTLNSGVTLPISLSGNDGFIVKYDTNGNALWATTIRGNGTGDSAEAIATDSTSVYVTGYYRSTSVVTLNSGKTLPISVGNDVLIAKYDRNGNALWATTIQGTGNDVGQDVATDSTGVYVTGYYNSTSVVALPDAP